MISTFSGFTYGHTITVDNQYIDFNEGSGEINGQLNVGVYSLAEFVNEVARALNELGSLTYTTTLDRSTRKITISATGTFSLLITSGIFVNSSVFGLAGFTGADLSGSASYEGDSASGSFFEPQFLLQDYVSFIDEQKAVDSTVNESGSGRIEVVTFGNQRFMTCNVTLQNDYTQKIGGPIKNDPAGVTNLRNFLIYGVTKATLEFVPDIDSPTVFTKCILESTPSDSKGTGFKLNELIGRGLMGYYESGRLRFRGKT
jgi:hypothetical protein